MFPIIRNTFLIRTTHPGYDSPVAPLGLIVHVVFVFLYTCRPSGAFKSGQDLHKDFIALIIHSLDFRWVLQRLVGRAYPTIV